MKYTLVITVAVFTILSLGFFPCRGEMQMKELTNLLGEEILSPDGRFTILQTTLELNEMAFVKCEQWGSVGIDCEYEISDDQIVSFIKSEVKYRYPERMKPGWTGGDSAEKILLFKANKPGSALLKIHRMFRGERKETRLISIIIK